MSVLAACSGPAAQPTAEQPTAVEQPTTAMQPTTVMEPTTAMEPTAVMEPTNTEMPSLADVCPNPIVVQTDWFPEAEHGALYEMVGDNYTIDTSTKVVRGSLIAHGKDTGIDIEVRTGGPAIGFQQPIQQMYVEDSITVAYVSTNEAVFGSQDVPTLTVMAPLEKNPQIIMWDPGTYPDIQTIADLGKKGVTVLYFAGGTFIDVFVAQGILTKDQVDPSYDGSPARWIAANGTIAQQGFASAEPYTYQYEIPEWGKPVAYQLIHDAGFEIYSQALAIRTADLEKLSPCLKQFVPIVQQAVVDYVADPSRANAIILDAVKTYNDFWIYSQGLADYSYQTQIKLGLVGNGPDSTVGNLDLDRIQGVVDQMIAAGLSVDPNLKASDITTNEFIDSSIGLP
jgi:hypothetical protein